MAATTAPPPATVTATRVKWVPLHSALSASALAIFFMPTPHGLTRPGQVALAISAFTIVLWAFGVMNNGVASVLMMALLIPAGAKPSLALSGFSSGSWWILLAVLYYGFAMQKTGLAARISYYILSSFPCNVFRHPGFVFRNRHGAVVRHSVHDRPHRHHGSDRLGAGEVAGSEAAQQRLRAHHADHHRDGRRAWTRTAVRFSRRPGRRVRVRVKASSPQLSSRTRACWNYRCWCCAP